MLNDPSTLPMVVYADFPAGADRCEQTPVGTAVVERQDLIRLRIDDLVIVCRRSSGVLRVKSFPLCSVAKYVVSIELGPTKKAAQFVTGIGTPSDRDLVIHILGDIPFDGDLLVNVDPKYPPSFH